MNKIDFQTTYQNNLQVVTTKVPNQKNKPWQKMHLILLVMPEKWIKMGHRNHKNDIK